MTVTGHRNIELKMSMDFIILHCRKEKGIFYLLTYLLTMLKNRENKRYLCVLFTYYLTYGEKNSQTSVNLEVGMSINQSHSERVPL